MRLDGLGMLHTSYSGGPGNVQTMCKGVISCFGQCVHVKVIGVDSGLLRNQRLGGQFRVG
jgi:hypothetical protein